MVLSKASNSQDKANEVIVKGILKKEGMRNMPKKRKVVEEVDAVSPRQSEFLIKAKSHEDLEIEIQSKRILYVLDEAIYKLHIGSCLGLLIEDEGKLLKHYLSQEEVEFIVDSCAKYVDSDVYEYESSAEGRSTPKFLQQFSLSKDSSRVDMNVAQSIDIIFRCKELMQNIGLLPRSESSLSEKFIDGVHRLRMAIAQKLSISAAEEIQREKELRIAWKENADAKVLIASIQEKLDKQTEELQIQLNTKNELIEEYKAKIQNMTKIFQVDIRDRVTQSEKAMVQSSQLSEERQSALGQEVKERAQEYQALIESHLAAEKILRAKRFKVEAQLASWLAKYDQDIGDRQAELEELTRLYNEEMQEVKNLQTKLNEQEEDYTVLMAERDAYEEGINNQKAYEFLCGRAARRIQRFWRAYRERKMLRKKGKKGKKKKKSAGEGGDGGGDSAGTTKDKTDIGATDPNVHLAAAFKGDILDDISTEPLPTVSTT